MDPVFIFVTNKVKKRILFTEVKSPPWCQWPKN